MREAPALAGVSGSSRSRSSSGRARSTPSAQGWRQSLLARAFKRPGVTIAGAAFAALMTGIVANAMFFQKGHHPAPMFAAAPAKTVAPAPAPVPPATLTADAPAVPAQASEAAPATAVPVTESAVAPAPAKAVAAKKPVHKTSPARGGKDAIGSLIGTLNAKAEPQKSAKASPTLKGAAPKAASHVRSRPDPNENGVAPHA